MRNSIATRRGARANANGQMRAVFNKRRLLLTAVEGGRIYIRAWGSAQLLDKARFGKGNPSKSKGFFVAFPAKTRYGARESAGGARQVNIVLNSIVVFVLFLAAGYAGLQLQTRLAQEHKTGETKGVVGQVAGLLTLLLALVLGTLIGVSFAYFSGQRTESRELLRPDFAARSGARAIRAGDQAFAGQKQGGNRQRL